MSISAPGDEVEVGDVVWQGDDAAGDLEDESPLRYRDYVRLTCLQAVEHEVAERAGRQSKPPDPITRRRMATDHEQAKIYS